MFRRNNVDRKACRFFGSAELLPPVHDADVVNWVDEVEKRVSCGSVFEGQILIRGGRNRDNRDKYLRGFRPREALGFDAGWSDFWIPSDDTRRAFVDERDWERLKDSIDGTWIVDPFPYDDGDVLGYTRGNCNSRRRANRHRRTQRAHHTQRDEDGDRPAHQCNLRLKQVPRSIRSTHPSKVNPRLGSTSNRRDCLRLQSVGINAGSLGVPMLGSSTVLTGPLNVFLAPAIHPIQTPIARAMVTSGA